MRYPITTGQVSRPLRIAVYGPEGIGKSTLASQAPSPLFVDTEEGTHQLDVARRPKPRDWGQLLDMVAAVAEDPSCCSTLVVDTLDGAEALCVTHVCSHATPKKDSIEAFGYGKGYVHLKEEFAKLLRALDAVVAAGVNVVCTSHSQLRKFERPDELGQYDRFEMKLTKHVAPLVKEWCDVLLFADYQTYVSVGENGGRAKASGGRRVMRTTHSPSWDAKNRLGLPEVMDLDMAPLVGFLAGKGEGGREAEGARPLAEPEDVSAIGIPEDILTEDPERFMLLAGLVERMGKDEVGKDELEETVAARGYQPEGTELTGYDSDFLRWLTSQWDNVREAVEINRIEVPFDTSDGKERTHG